MLKHFLGLFILSLALMGCNVDQNTSVSPMREGTKLTPDGTTLGSEKGEYADQGALEQSENESDRQVTQAIRQMLMADDGLSTESKNITIVTRNGVVTLKGIVATSIEKLDIIEKAQAAAGVRNVVDKLVVSEKE
ncbi:MAG: BON domain-containing protein [Parachlamydiaceae bacterium]